MESTRLSRSELAKIGELVAQAQEGSSEPRAFVGKAVRAVVAKVTGKQVAKNVGKAVAAEAAADMATNAIGKEDVQIVDAPKEEKKANGGASILTMASIRVANDPGVMDSLAHHPSLRELITFRDGLCNR